MTTAANEPRADLDVDEQPFDINDDPPSSVPKQEGRPDAPMQDQPMDINDNTVDAD